MIEIFEGKKPSLSPKAFVSDEAVVAGDVMLGDYASIWHNCSARGDVNYIRIGCYSNIQDNSVLHVADDCPCLIEDYVTVGHGAILHGCHVESHVLIGMGAIVLNGAVVGEGSIVAAGAVVREGTKIPPNSLVAGVPAKVVKEIDDRRDMIHAQAIKYKHLWSVRYGIMPDIDGERYHGEEIV